MISSKLRNFQKTDEKLISLPNQSNENFFGKISNYSVSTKMFCVKPKDIFKVYTFVDTD